MWVDEITVGEPITPKLVFRDVFPFRSHIADLPAKPVADVSAPGEQPILGESWGVQATVVPQQLGDKLDMASVAVYAYFYPGVSPWGYEQWKDSPKAIKMRLEQVSSNLVFRSTYNNPESVIGPERTPVGTFPDNVWQFHLRAEFLDTDGVAHASALGRDQWAPPSWYYGIKNLNETYGAGDDSRFAAYTILDSISPLRAWLNEVNLYEAGELSDYTNQFVEIAAPQGADLTGWRIDAVDLYRKRGTIARFGSSPSAITSKLGTRPGVDATNHYTFIALRSPTAKEKGGVPEADGAWMKTPTDSAGTGAASLLLDDGNLRAYAPYGLALVRPSGVIEHQIVIEGRNYNAGTSAEYYNSGTNLLAQIKAVDGDGSHWFYAGADAAPGTLGVFRSHGEDASCWTNQMVATPAALNKMKDGTLQDIDPLWFLLPNGTNIWIYSTLLGDHVHQLVGASTNRAAMLIVPKGSSTNIVYTTDPWYQLGEVTTNGVALAEARGRASRADGHTWTLQLKNVEATVDVTVGEEADKDVTDAGLDPNDPYYRAVMAWLAGFGEGGGIRLAEQWDLANRKVGTLDLLDMYWLNINPTNGNWVLKAGMGGVGVPPPAVAPVAPLPREDPALGPVTNVRLVVTMLLTNTVTGVHHGPDRIQGLAPGTSSYAYDGRANWTGATFKICGALQRDGVRDTFCPLRWFVFGPDSFDAQGRALIEIDDPHAPNSPGYANGWGDDRELPIFYKWTLDRAFPDTGAVDVLKADATYK